MTILSQQDLNTMRLPVDLSGYTPTDLNSMLRQAEAWVNGEARHARGFEAHRVVDRVVGTGTNKLRTNYYPVCVLNGIQLIFPANTGNVNLPGNNQVPIDPSRVVIDHDAGILYNWSPFVFQTIGYMTVFPEGVPINIDYYTGYVSTYTTSAMTAGATVIPVSNNSTFYFGQTIRFYEPAAPEFLTVQSTTAIGTNYFVITQEPTQYAHANNMNIGDMPPEIRLATAFVVCDMALRELNPENLLALRMGNIHKEYQRELPVRSKGTNVVTGPQIETERPFLKEARRLLEHYYTDRGII